MTTFPGAPKLTKGAIVGFDLMNPLASVIIFQYNPKKLIRKVEARTAGEDSAHGSTLRLQGAPKEVITIQELEMDAADQLEQGDGDTGIYPQLSALEMLVYPKSLTIILSAVTL